MIRRLFATSLVCLCLLTAPVLPAFGQSNNPNGTTQNGTTQNGTKQNVPEPSATLLLVLALGGVGVLEWWRRSRTE